MNTCKNCTQNFNGHFCNNCGQPAETHTINIHFLWHDIQHGLFHFDNGILYTSKQLFTRPGNSIREFIEGKRVKHFRPISLVIVLATVYGLLYHTFHINIMAVDLSGTVTKIIDVNKINEWVSTHYSWVTLITIPFYALGSFISFRKQGYNFVEHLVMNAFLAGQRLILRIVTFPLLYIYNETPALKVIEGILVLLEFLLMAWGYSQFFNHLSKVKSFLFTVLAYLIFLACIIITNAGIFGGFTFNRNQ